MTRLSVYTFALAGLILFACDNGNSTNPAGGNNNNGGSNTAARDGFGVSGLLFENNLVMWDRDHQGEGSELFPQMYFMRADAPDFPTWGSFPSDQLVSGGVPRDGIPALSNPEFVSPTSSAAGYLQDSDIVLGTVLHGVAKAYPENILWWHEIVNDVTADQSVMMTFCPLTGTGMFFSAPDLDANSDRLELLPVVETTWEKWRKLYPNTTVISGNTGFSRNYTLYPYGSYRSEQTQPLFPLRTRDYDRRFPPKHIVLGLIEGAVQKAYPFSKLEDNPVVNDEVNGSPVLIISDISSQLAIPYYRNVNDQVLTFTLTSSAPFQMTDNETNTVWDIKGQAVSGSLAGATLRPVPAYNAFWFAWSVFWPSTQVFEN